MPQATVYFDLADTSDPAFDGPIEWMLIALLAIGPLSMGAVQPWSETIVCALALAMGIALAIKLLRKPDVPFVRSWTYWPIAAFLALIALQLLPLPASVVRMISPHTWTLKNDLLGELPNATARLKWMTLSFYPEVTLRQLKLVTAMAVLFIVVVNCIRRVSQIRRLLGAIAIIGGVFAILAIAQYVSGATEIYWFVPNTGGYSVRGGPFPNRNHFGQFMNMSIGAAAGLVLVLVNQHFRRDNYTSDEVRAKLRSEPFRPAWLLLLMVVLGAGSVFLSLSRGAMISAAVAGTIMGVVLVTRRGAHGKGWMFFVVVLCVVAIALLDYRGIATRLTQESGDKWTGRRIELLRDLSVVWKQFPIFGTGLGTHASIFAMYDRSNFTYFPDHAENEYAQVLTETGAIGLLLTSGFIGIVIGALVRALRGPMSPASSAAMGLGYGLLAVLIQSATDFGQHAPANAALTAVASALVLNLAQLRERELDTVSTELSGRGRLWARLAAVGLMIALAVTVLWDDVSAWRADTAWSVAQRIDGDLQKRNWIAENPEYADLLDAAGRAARLRPRNIEYHYGLNFYRWKSITRLRDADTGALFTPGSIPEYAAHIVNELHDGRWLCPTHGPTLILSGQIERSILNRAREGRRHIDQGLALSGADPMAAFVAGEAAAVDGDIATSMKDLRRAAELSPSIRVDVSDVYFRTLKRSDLALEVADDDLDTLNLLVKRLEKLNTPEAASLAAQAREHAFRVLSARADAPDASASLLAQMAEELVHREQRERAIPYFHRALLLEYGQTEWRMELAKVYEDLGKDKEAMREAESCLRRRPQMPEALELVARLTDKAEKAATRSNGARLR